MSPKLVEIGVQFKMPEAVLRSTKSIKGVCILHYQINNNKIRVDSLVCCHVCDKEVRDILKSLMVNSTKNNRKIILFWI